jgi:hypothetical protein
LEGNAARSFKHGDVIKNPIQLKQGDGKNKIFGASYPGLVGSDFEFTRSPLFLSLFLIRGDFQVWNKSHKLLGGFTKRGPLYLELQEALPRLEKQRPEAYEKLSAKQREQYRRVLVFSIIEPPTRETGVPASVDILFRMDEDCTIAN